MKLGLFLHFLEWVDFLVQVLWVLLLEVLEKEGQWQQELWWRHLMNFLEQVLEQSEGKQICATLVTVHLYACIPDISIIKLIHCH